MAQPAPHRVPHDGPPMDRAARRRAHLRQAVGRDGGQRPRAVRHQATRPAHPERRVRGQVHAGRTGGARQAQGRQWLQLQRRALRPGVLRRGRHARLAGLTRRCHGEAGQAPPRGWRGSQDRQGLDVGAGRAQRPRGIGHHLGRPVHRRRVRGYQQALLRPEVRRVARGHGADSGQGEERRRVRGRLAPLGLRPVPRVAGVLRVDKGGCTEAGVGVRVGVRDVAIVNPSVTAVQPADAARVWTRRRGGGGFVVCGGLRSALGPAATARDGLGAPDEALAGRLTRSS
mmetsp:Transcript_8353/g.38059  ORF Transcript_8353/g.38059 Transcript_8353/m.38059 type:complete len:286 (+) Transcript_8353:276-1133(+)